MKGEKGKRKTPQTHRITWYRYSRLVEDEESVKGGKFKRKGVNSSREWNTRHRCSRKSM